MQNLIVLQKDCGECTKCCEGWLHAKIKDNILSPENQCVFLKTGPDHFGCSIYEERPIKPCRIFNCLWVLTDMPDNLKPSVSGVISTQNKIDGVPYIFLVNAPNYPSNELIDWFNIKYPNSNILYFNNNDTIVFNGSKEFKLIIETRKEEILNKHLELSKHYIKNI